jgi:D-proline reductase (dithiol) PrdB
MEKTDKVVDGFHFVPPGLRALFLKDIPKTPFLGSIPWTPFRKRIEESTFSLVTSAGISMKTDPPFDVEREKRDPFWGDPTYREIPRNATEMDIDVNHLHINTDYIREDMNVMFPLKRFAEFEEEGLIGKLAPTCYSYYGYQHDPTELLKKAMPKVASRMKEERVEAVLLTPA